MPIAMALGLAGCDVVGKTVEPTPIVAAGKALPIGLLDTTAINALPEGDVKTSLENELNSVKQECFKVPGCLGDSVSIYRVITHEGAYSIRFGTIHDGKEPDHTQILSMIDGKTQKETVINKDLLAKDTVVNGVTTRVFGYVDDAGNSHYILEEQGVGDNEQFLVFDAQGASYDVVTQNAQEVQAYSHLWSEPGVVYAESLPTATAGVSTPIVEVPTATAKATEAPKPTPTKVEFDYSQAFFDPQNESDLAKVIDAPSPIEKAVDFAKWQEEYVAAVEKKLETYSGYVLDSKYIGITFDQAELEFDASDHVGGINLEVVASYKFVWQGNTIVTKTFALKLYDGTLIPFSVTYSNLPRKNQDDLKTPSDKKILMVNYAPKVTPAQPDDPFSDSFFAAQLQSTDMDAMRLVLSGKGTAEQKARISRMPFVLFTYLDP
jgi:hypothetical protein